MLLSRGREWTFAVFLAAAAAGLLCTMFVVGSAYDEEEFRFAILSTALRVRALADGHAGFWTPLLAFGVPQPFIPNFTLHPLTPLLAGISPVAWSRVLLVVHTVVGAAGMWRLGGALGLSPLIQATGVVTFLLVAPVQNYVLSDFWPSHFIVWTLAPWLLFLAWRLLSRDTRQLRRWSCALAATAGIAAANSNPAYLLVFAPLAALVVATHIEMARLRWRWLSLAALVALATAAANGAQLVAERSYFAPQLALSNVTDPLSLRSAASNLFPSLREGVRDARSIFVGAPYALLAVAGCFWFARRRADLVVSAIILAVMLFTPWIPMPWISQRYQFRDPLTLCAILLAGLALNELWRRPRLRPVAAIFVVLQIASVMHGAWPLLQRMVDPPGRRAAAPRGATGATALVDRLVALTTGPGRLAYSPQVDYAISERGFVDDGLGVNALAYRGVAVVNGSFKSVSTDVISPDDRLFYGRVRVPQPLIASSVGLDVLGIRYLLARRDEIVAPGLAELASFETSRGTELVLHVNQDAWPGAFLVPPSFGDEELPILPACPHDRLLCRDLSPIATHRDARPITVVRDGTTIHVRWTPTPEPRILVVTDMFRPAWRAYAHDRPVATRQMYGALIGIPLPAGIGEVRLEYRPRSIFLATILSYVVLVGAVVAAAVPSSRFRVPRSGSAFEF